MSFQYSSLLVAAIFSSGAIAFTLLANWMGMRKERHLILGSIGLMLFSLALALMSMRNGRYDAITLSVPFSLLLLGLSFIHASIRVSLNKTNLWPSVILGASTIVASIAPYFIGLMGLGGIAIEVAAAAILALCAFEYFTSRTDSRLIVLTLGSLYLLVAVTYFTSSVLLTMEDEWVRYPAEDRWYDGVNAIVSLLGITGIGALIMVLHFTRAAKADLEAARTDPLTGVLNRRALFERFAESTVIPGVPVLAFDLDHFKLINDQLGHAHGDVTLQRFAEVLRRTVGERGVTARIGGEEFCAILPDRTKHEAQAIAEGICTGFAGLAISRGDGNAVATVSVGLATGGEGEPFVSVLSRADAALYKAKSKGRNMVCVEEPHLAA